MSNIDKRALREAAERATKGEWRRASTAFNGITASAFSLTGVETILAHTVEKRDAEFIAAADPATVLALLDELEAKDKRIAEQRETLLAARSHVMQCARLGDAHANGVLQAIDRAAAEKGETS